MFIHSLIIILIWTCSGWYVLVNTEYVSLNISSELKISLYVVDTYLIWVVTILLSLMKREIVKYGNAWLIEFVSTLEVRLGIFV